MTNKEKCEIISKFTNEKDVIGILASFMIDDAYKDVDFIKYMRKSYPNLFENIHSIIIEELDKQKKILESCVALLGSSKVSDDAKSKIAVIGKELAEKNVAIAGAAKELCETFEKTSK